MRHQFRALRAVLLAALFIGLVSPVGAGEPEIAFQERLTQAQAGDRASMFRVGQMFDLGLGTKRDREQALRWYRRAAESGHADAAYQMGYSYYWGRGLTKDYTQAHKFFLAAAELGNRAALPYLSKMYALGQGVARDRKAAEKWSKLARERISRTTSEREIFLLDERDRVAASKQPRPRPAAPAAPVAKAAPAKPVPLKTAAKPKPRATPKAPAKPRPKPKPKRAVASRPQPKRASKPSKAAKAPPAKQPARAAAKPRPAAPKPVPPPPPAQPEPVRPQDVRDQVANANWARGRRTVTYLPSSKSTCIPDGDDLVCNSDALVGAALGRSYEYRIRSTLSDFTAEGRFNIKFATQVLNIRGFADGYAAGDDVGQPEAVRAEAEKRRGRLYCEIKKKETIECLTPRGRRFTYKKKVPN